MNVILKCLTDFKDVDDTPFTKGSLYYCLTEGSHINNINAAINLKDSETGKEFIISLIEASSNFEVYLQGTQNPISVDDHVYFLKDARKHLGIVTKVNKKTFKVKTCGSNWFKYPEDMNISKEKVAHHEDVCTIVCDYIKDPNGMSVRFEYGNEFHESHKQLELWGSQPSEFLDII